ncbi:MAG: tetratricopeptide repeat protein [Chitinophagaceae bacterium]|nr:tetratricopeptide repeat protein [Chitinophagaceae bacterium]
MLKRTKSPLFIFLLLLGFSLPAICQPSWTFEPFGKQKKPEKFENRKLGSEKTADKKFNVPRNIYQNNITHYNYYFNANNRVNTVVDRAKLSLKDDYSNMLAFYPYTLEGTASQKIELDSVIYTSTAGILLHDLRNDWIDNMYMLIGKAYYFRKDFDSALMTFQFINYNLFPRKRKNDDDDRIVGTNSISIANKEKRNVLQKLTALPPSRNDAILWLARTLIELNEFAESGGLINTLQVDPNLPKRLRNDLAEVNAYWFFKQGFYDSTAKYLEKALSTADNKQDQSRWEFLLAQLYEKNGDFDKASSYYDKASKHTVDPLLDIHARLNDAKMLRTNGNPKELDKAIDNLAKMGRRDKYEAYRDIVYYSAGDLSLQKPDTNAAISFLKKSLKYNENNINYKNRAFLKLGDIAYSRKQYRLAAAMYDSLQTGGSDSLLNLQIAAVQQRKEALLKIAAAITAIEKEDSVQRIALMPAAEREEYLKKMLRKLRKEKGYKDDGNAGGGGDISPFNNNNQPPLDLFAGNSKGEWYFYNNTLKSRGFTDFKSRWGRRINTDNWRRNAAAEAVNNQNQQAGGGDKGGTKPGEKNAGGVPNTSGAAEITLDVLMKDIPLTEERIKESNDVIAVNMIILAQAYQNDLEEYQLAADTYEAYLKRFPNRLLEGDVYLNLYFCYTKLGLKDKAAYYKDLLNSNYANTLAGKKLNNPSSLNPKTKDPEATKLYEDIYNLFIEGDFEKAMAEKKKADSLYGVNYWTPQLLYIEALHHVKNRDDSAAIKGLQLIISNNPTSPLKEKAATMIDVLRRRAEIEKYLTSLEVTRASENQLNVPETPKPVPPPVIPPVIKDTVVKVAAPLTSGAFTMAVNAPHHVLMVLNKVDQVYITEARNAFIRYNRENFYGQTINISKDVLDADNNLLVITSFPDAAAALIYYNKIKKDAASEISWLPANKYSFLIITEANLQLLKTNKNIAGYKALLNTQFPNRF